MILNRENLSKIDLDLQVRVQIALDVWAHGARIGALKHVFVIATDKGEVTLRGRISGREHCAQVSAVVRTIPGVELVCTQIAVTRDNCPLALR